MSWVADRMGLTVPLCLLALIAAAAWLAVRDLRYALSLVQNADAEHLIGWDLLPTCHGLAALAAGKDPYIHSNLAHTPGPASWMAYYYPIAAAYPAKLICMAHCCQALTSASISSSWSAVAPHWHGACG